MTERTRLLLVSGNTFSSNPWEQHTARLWRELSQGFDEVHVVARAQDQQFHRVSKDRVTLHLIPRGSARMATFLLTSWLLPLYALHIRPTHVQAQSAVYGGLPAAVYGRLFGVPVMIEVHGEHYLRNRPHGENVHRYFYRPLTAVAFSLATQIRSLSPEMSTAIKDVYGSHVGEKIREIPNRVDLSVFSPPKSDFGTSGPLKVVTVGALVSNKNHLELVSILSKQNPRPRLTIVGSGPLLPELKVTAARLGVHLTLYEDLNHSELARVLRSHDVYVQLSRSEAVSRAVLEAMAMALPVVITPVGFMKGIVDTGVTGLRLESEDELLDALNVLSVEAVRRQLGQNARRRIEEQHEWGAVFGLHIETLKAMTRQ